MRRFFAIVLLLAGCYNPQLGSPSFFCHPQDVPACPDGQKCVGERCVAQSAKAIDLGHSDDGMMSSNDSGSQSMPDLSSPGPQPDLAMPSCQPKGGPCPNKNNAICCSNYCIYSTSTCK